MPVPEVVEVEVFSSPVNGWIVRTPGREFPGVVVQGDSLSVLFDLAQSILDRCRTDVGTHGEVLDDAEALRDALWARLAAYEAVLKEHGLSVPYVRTRAPT